MVILLVGIIHQTRTQDAQTVKLAQLAKTPEIGPKQVQKWSKTVHKCSKTGPNQVQQWSKSAPKQVQKWSKTSPKKVHNGPKVVHNRSKLGPKQVQARSKTGPSQVQNRSKPGPKVLQKGFITGPKQVHKWFQQWSKTEAEERRSIINQLPPGQPKVPKITKIFSSKILNFWSPFIQAALA